jgi:hypothetical protein
MFQGVYRCRSCHALPKETYSGIPANDLDQLAIASTKSNLGHGFPLLSWHSCNAKRRGITDLVAVIFEDPEPGVN